MKHCVSLSLVPFTTQQQHLPPMVDVALFWRCVCGAHWEILGSSFTQRWDQRQTNRRLKICACLHLTHIEPGVVEDHVD